MHTPSQKSQRCAYETARSITAEKENQMTGVSPLTRNKTKSPFAPAESIQSSREQQTQSNLRSVRRDTDSQIDVLWSCQGQKQSISSFELIKESKPLQKVLTQGKLSDKQAANTINAHSSITSNLKIINSQEIQNSKHKSYYLKTEDSPRITQTNNRNHNNINNASLQIFNESLHTPHSQKQECLSVKSSLALSKRNNLSNTSKSPLQSARVAPTTPNSFYQQNSNNNNNSSYLSSEAPTARTHFSKEGCIMQNSQIENTNLEKNDTLSFKEQYLKNKRNLEQNHVSQALEKKELARLSVSSENLKKTILHLQSLLQEQNAREIAKDREEECKSSRDRRVNEVQEEFLKKSTQMAQLFEEVSQQYLEFEENLKLAEQTQDIDLETKALLKEDLNGRLIQRAELVAHKEDLEAISCQFQRQYEEEAKYLLEEIAISETALKAQQQLREFSQEHQDTQTNLRSQENNLQVKNQQLGVLTEKLAHLSAVISKEKEIPSNQLCQSESRLRDIQNEYSIPDLELICCNYLRKIQGNGMSFEVAPAIQQIVLGIRQHKDGISLDDVLVYIERQCLNGQSIQFKRQYIPAVEGLLRSLLSLEHINNKYYKVETELVAEYEQITKDIDAINKEIKEQNEKASWLRAQNAQIEATLSSCQGTLGGLNEKYGELVVKNTQVVFSDYLGKSDEQFKQIALEHGEVETQKLINSRKEEFERLMQEEQEVRLRRMRSVYDEIVLIESKIARNVNIVQDDILPKLKLILSDLPLASARLEQMKADIAAYQQAKKRLNQDMHLLDDCLQQKIEDINKNSSEEFTEAVLSTERIEVEIKEKIRQLKQEAVAIERTRQNIQIHIQSESQIRQQLRIFEEQCVLQDANNLWINKSTSIKQKCSQDFYQKRLSQQQPQIGFMLSNPFKNHSKSSLDGCNINPSGVNSQSQQLLRPSQLGNGQNNENGMDNLKNIQVSCHQVKQHGSVSMWEGGNKHNNANKQQQLSYSREQQPSFKQSGYNPQVRVPLVNKKNSDIQDMSYNQQQSLQTIPSYSHSYSSQSNNILNGNTGSVVTQIAFPNSLKIRNSNDFSNSQILNSSNILSRSTTISSSINQAGASPSKTSRNNRSPKNSYQSRGKV